jgi:hypothetical protein
VTADFMVPTFTKNVKVGQPACASSGRQPRVASKAPPSRKEREKGRAPAKQRKCPFCRKVVKPPGASIFFQAADSEGNINIEIMSYLPPSVCYS